MGAFQVRQFLLTSYASERALLCAVAECFGATSLLVTYNGKTFDVPVMETRWLFHRMSLPLESVRHFDMLHPARRLWRAREDTAKDVSGEGGCRLGTLERVLCDVRRVGDIPGMDIPARYFRFLRSGNALPLEPVLEHNRLDLISLAAVCAHAVQLVQEGSARCRDAAEALALGKVYERAGCIDKAMKAYEHAAADPAAHIDVVLEAIYRLGVRLRRDRRFAEAADCWRRLLEVKQPRLGRRSELLVPLRQYAVEALAIHHEHRERDYEGARELTLRLLDESDEGSFHLPSTKLRTGKAEATKHRLARLEKKIARRNDNQLFA
jgi:tetratricopeptide (TPR) repeat protein